MCLRQNAFFNPLEWIPVVSSALAIRFLLVTFAVRITVPYLWLGAAVLLVQRSGRRCRIRLHAAADLQRPGLTLFERVLSGAPPLAPLLTKSSVRA